MIKFSEEYNSIVENNKYYILLKRTDSQPILYFPFKDIAIRVGKKDDQFLLHSLIYPKSRYTLENVEKIQLSSKECPLCVQGLNVVEFTEDNEEFNKYHFNNNIKGDFMPINFQEAIKSMGEEFKNPKKGANTSDITDFLTEGIGAGISLTTGILFDNISSEMIVGRILKGILGIGALASTLIPEKIETPNAAGVKATWENPIKHTSGSFKMARTLGWSSLVCALDPRPEDVQRMANEAKMISSQIKSAISLGPSDVINVIKDRFKVPQLNLSKLRLAAGSPSNIEIRGIPEMGKSQIITSDTTSKRINIR